MDREFKIIKNYRENELLRNEFCRLSKKIFGLDFEDWYQNGYWTDNYIPYSVAVGERIVANVSVNIMDMMNGGKMKHYIQLGTVMTDEAYRNKGLIRMLMEEIDKDYQYVEGVYLFANDSVLNFYPKFGFNKAEEFQYSKEVCIKTQRNISRISMSDKSDWHVLEQAIKSSVRNESFGMDNNMELIMFYITKFMQDNVYYIKDNDIYVIAEEDNNNLLIHNIFAKEAVDLDMVISAFGKGIRRVTLGFAPLDGSGYTISRVQQEDTTLFVKGKIQNEFENAKIMFPTLSHA